MLGGLVVCPKQFWILFHFAICTIWVNYWVIFSFWLLLKFLKCLLTHEKHCIKVFVIAKPRPLKISTINCNLKSLLHYRFIAKFSEIYFKYTVYGSVEITGYTIESEISLDNPLSCTHASSKLIHTFDYHGHGRPRRWFMQTK